MNRFENGLHSFKKAVNVLVEREKDEYFLKDAIIYFHHAIEALFKHILAEKSTYLVYENVDTVINDIYNGKKKQEEHHTISFMSAIKRVAVIYEVKIESEKHGQLEMLNKLRNGMTHDVRNLDSEEVSNLMVNLLPVVIETMEKVLRGKEREDFVGVMDKIEKAQLKVMYAGNDKWRLITIVNTLNAIIDNEGLTIPNYMRKMLSMLGYIDRFDSEDIMDIRIDEPLYSSEIRFLKNQIVYNVVKSECSQADIPKKIHEQIINVCKEYLTEKAEELRSEDLHLQDNIDLIQKHAVLMDIANVVGACVDKYGGWKGRYENFRKELPIADTNLDEIYTKITKWYNDNGWYDKRNIDKLGEDVKELFNNASEDNSLLERIYSEETFYELIGEFGKWSSIDYIDEVYLYDVVYVIKRSEDEYDAIIRCEVETATHMDREAHHMGTEEVYISVRYIRDENGELVSDDEKEVEFLGRV